MRIGVLKFTEGSPYTQTRNHIVHIFKNPTCLISMHIVPKSTMSGGHNFVYMAPGHLFKTVWLLWTHVISQDAPTHET